MPIGGMSPSGFRGSVVACGQYVITATLPTPATTVAGFVGSVAVPGVRAGDFVLVSPTSYLTAGVAYTGQATADDVVAITVTNGSGGASTGGSKVVNILVLRPKTA